MMTSLLVVQKFFSTPNFFVVPLSMAYVKSIYDKKSGVGPFIQELFTKKNPKSVKNCLF